MRKIHWSAANDLTTAKSWLFLFYEIVEMKSLFTILFTGLLINTYGQKSLIGKWRRVNQSANQDVNRSKQAQTSDLTLYPDSTFFIQGDSTTKNSTMPGWHSGTEYTGTWEQTDKNHLYLFPTPKQDRLFLPYIIVELTSEKLVLRSTFDNKKNKLLYLTYRRIWPLEKS